MIQLEVITNGYEDITKGYEDITKGYNEREWEGVGTIGLDWLGRGCGEGSLVLKGIPAGLVFSAWSSPHSSPHSPLPQSFSSPLSTSI